MSATAMSGGCAGCVFWDRSTTPCRCGNAEHPTCYDQPALLHNGCPFWRPIDERIDKGTDLQQASKVRGALRDILHTARVHEVREFYAEIPTLTGETLRVLDMNDVEEMAYALDSIILNLRSAQ